MSTLILLNGKAIVITDKGETLQKENVTEKEAQLLCNGNLPDEELYEIMIPEYKKKKEERQILLDFQSDILNSHILSLKGDSIYWTSISEISLPQKFAEAVIRAEKENNEDKLIAYKNFWTLCGLNPDERCRKNLFWFLDKNEYVISKCGFFVGYRNVLKYGQDADGTTVYTDGYTRTFRIRIGEVVTLPREECDVNQEHVCAPGLMCSPL